MPAAARAASWAHGLALRAGGWRPPGRGPVVLLYHRIARAAPDPWALAVTPERFAEHLQALQRAGVSVVPLLRLAQAVREKDRAFLEPGRSGPRRVAITFDDGYADNLHAAKPLLDRTGMPATVFIATANLESGCGFWVDTLGELLLGAGRDRLPSRIDLSVCGMPVRQDGLRNRSDEERSARRRGPWRAWERPRAAREALYQQLYALLARQPPDARYQAMGALLDWAGIPEAERRALNAAARPLTAAEVRQMSRDGLVEIGAHTIRHPCLAALPAIAAQREEVIGGRRRAEEMVGAPVRGFAYPYGRPGTDYTDETVGLVREAGFEYGCANVHGAVAAATSPWELPRVQVQDWTGEEFARRLCL